MNPPTLMQENVSITTFTANLLEHIMLAAGSTDIKAGPVQRHYMVRLGKVSFLGKDKEEAYRKALYWLSVSPYSLTREEYAAQAEKVLRAEAEETEKILDSLAEGGMSDFGKRVQEYRANRGGVLATALHQACKEGKVLRDVNETKAELEKRTGYTDIGTEEILVLLTDYQRAEEGLSSTTSA